MRLRALIAAFLIAAFGAVAMASAAGVTVYKTSFKSRSDVREIRALSGPKKSCRKNWRDKTALGVTAKGGPADCTLATPVVGDAAQPNHIVRVVAKMNKATDKKVRKKFFLGVVVRADRKEDYELRVFPGIRKFQLLKSGQVLEQGKDNAVARGAKKNRLQIEARGQTVTGSVNGKEVASFRDENSEQVTARGTGLSYGVRKRSKKAQGVGFFDQLKVQVPTRG